jgi:hypothetical protein
MRHAAFLSVCLLALLAVPAQAGQLFPPANIGANPNVKCPNGEMLTWVVDHVECANPTPGVTVSCSSGQVLTGIQNGQPVCSSSGGAGLTGGCNFEYKCHAEAGVVKLCDVTTRKNWGNGCRSADSTLRFAGPPAISSNLAFSTVPFCDLAVATTGYSCGPEGDSAGGIGNGGSYYDSYTGNGRCVCVRK